MFILCVLLALKKANDKLCEKLSSGKRSTDKEMAALSWTVDELSKLNSMGRDLYIEVDNVLRLLEDPATNLVHQNVSRRIINLKDDLLRFVRGITRYKRTPATHILVTIISPSQRNKKPYALPVSYIPYAGLTEAKARKHINQVILEMTKRNMKVAGEYQLKINILNIFNFINIQVLSAMVSIMHFAQKASPVPSPFCGSSL